MRRGTYNFWGALEIGNVERVTGELKEKAAADFAGLTDRNWGKDKRKIHHRGTEKE